MGFSHTPPVPVATGIGLREAHVQDVLHKKPEIGFVEVHSENYFAGGLQRRKLLEIAALYPVSLHGVGLSLGRADGLDKQHLRQLAGLVAAVNPLFVSEHLSWSAYAHQHVPDLLPLPLTREALAVFTAHIDQFQEALRRPILIENPSNYLAFAAIDYAEPDFMAELVRRTGCGLLLDINNIAVSAHNLGYDADAYLDALPVTVTVQQMHLAGYQINTLDNGEQIYLDTHGKPVYPEVWALYAKALARFGDVPTLIEWDTDIPALDCLLAEAVKADRIRHAQCNAGAYAIAG